MSTPYAAPAGRHKGNRAPAVRFRALLLALIAFVAAGCARGPMHFDLETGLPPGSAERVAVARSGRFVAAVNPAHGSISVFPLDWSRGRFREEVFANPPRRIDVSEFGTPLDVAFGETTPLLDVCYVLALPPEGGVRLVRFAVSGTGSLSRPEQIPAERRFVALFDDAGGRRDPMLRGGVVKEGRRSDEEQIIVRVVAERDVLEVITIDSPMRTGSVSLGWTVVPPRVHVVPIPGGRPSDVALAAGGELVFVACPGLGAVRAFDVRRIQRRTPRRDLGALTRLDDPGPDPGRILEDTFDWGTERP